MGTLVYYQDGNSMWQLSRWNYLRYSILEHASRDSGYGSRYLILILQQSVDESDHTYKNISLILSGLLSVSIKPDGRFLGEDFPIGTNDSIAVEQSVSCCTTGVDITATDVRGNVVTCRADQCN